MTNLRGTKELYGVDPKELAHLSHIEAIELKLAGLKKRKNHLATEMSKYPKYEELVALEAEYRYVIKTITLNEFMLGELK